MAELTPGFQIRALRKMRKKSIENIAIQAAITYKTLSDIERGVTKQPAREVLQRILEALHGVSPLTVQSQQEVMHAFGYQQPYPIPSKIEISQAQTFWVEAYNDQIPYPAYLGDIVQRLLAWNSTALRLFGFTPTDLRLKLLEDITIFDLGFGLAPELAPIVNRDEFLSDLVRTMKAEFYPFRDQKWYHQCIDPVRKKYPLFDELWRAVSEEDIKKPLLGSSVPIVIDVPEAGPLTFRLTRVSFSNDPRFFISQWLPVDQKTINTCLRWNQSLLP